MAATMPFTRSSKVRFAHCDAAGIVFYPRYFEMLNALVEDWFEERLNASFASLHLERHIGTPTVSLSADFRAPSRLGETLDTTLRVERLSNSSCHVAIAFTCAGQERLVAKIVIVAMDLAGGGAVPWPDDIRQAMSSELSMAADATGSD